MKLEILLAGCSNEEMEAISPIIQASLGVIRKELIPATNKNRACIL